MGILTAPKSLEKFTATASKRRSVQTDFANLAPLKPGGALGFSTFRDSDLQPLGAASGGAKPGRKGTNGAMDSDDEDEDDDEVVGKLEDVDVKEMDTSLLSPEDAKRQSELAEGVRKIKVCQPWREPTTASNMVQLKRQHSAEPLNAGSPAMRKSPASSTPKAESPPPQTSHLATTPPSFGPGVAFDAGSQKPDDTVVGSPMKKQRASLSGLDHEIMHTRLGLGLSGDVGGVPRSTSYGDEGVKKEDDDEL